MTRAAPRIRLVLPADRQRMSAAVRSMLLAQADGDWGRITIDQSGALQVHNSAALASAAAHGGRPAPAAPSAPDTAPDRAKPATTSAEVSQSGARATPGPPAVSRRHPTLQASQLADVFGSAVPRPSGVRVVARPVGQRQQPAAQAALIDGGSFDWTTVNIGSTAAGLRARLQGGLPEQMQYTFLDDVRDICGVDATLVDDALRRPARVVVSPATPDKGYPVLIFYRGDLQIILGFRNPTLPLVMAAYALSRIDTDAIPITRMQTGGGGARRLHGLPRNVDQLVSRIRKAGGTVADFGLDATSAEVFYNGQMLGRVSVGPGTERSRVHQDWQRIQSKMGAIDAKDRSAAGSN